MTLRQLDGRADVIKGYVNLWRPYRGLVAILAITLAANVDRANRLVL